MSFRSIAYSWSLNYFPLRFLASWLLGLLNWQFTPKNRYYHKHTITPCWIKRLWYFKIIRKRGTTEPANVVKCNSNVEVPVVIDTWPLAWIQIRSLWIPAFLLVYQTTFNTASNTADTFRPTSLKFWLQYWLESLPIKSWPIPNPLQNGRKNTPHQRRRQRKSQQMAWWTCLTLWTSKLWAVVNSYVLMLEGRTGL